MDADLLTWRDSGIVRLHGLLGESRLADLRAEAQTRLTGETRLYERDGVTVQRDGSLASPAHCRMTDGGPVLTSILRDKHVLTGLREETGLARLFPVGGALVIYDEGDFQGFHTDSLKSTLTVVIALTDNLTPMGFAPVLRFDPDRRETHARQLADVISERGIFPDGFDALTHPYGEDLVQGFAGYDVPHWRAVHQDTTPGVIATLGYMDL